LISTGYTNSETSNYPVRRDISLLFARIKIVSKDYSLKPLSISKCISYILDYFPDHGIFLST